MTLDLDVAAERRAADEQSRRWHTWHVAALPSAKTFPRFADFVPAKKRAERPKRPQTLEEQIAIARAWSTAVGG